MLQSEQHYPEMNREQYYSMQHNEGWEACNQYYSHNLGIGKERKRRMRLLSLLPLRLILIYHSKYHMMPIPGRDCKAADVNIPRMTKLANRPENAYHHTTPARAKCQQTEHNTYQAVHSPTSDNVNDSIPEYSRPHRGLYPGPPSQTIEGIHVRSCMFPPMVKEQGPREQPISNFCDYTKYKHMFYLIINGFIFILDTKHLYESNVDCVQTLRQPLYRNV